MRRGILIGILLCMLLAVGYFLAGCKSENKNTLEGVWERVEGKFTIAGETISPTQKAIKIFTKDHWAIIEQEPNAQKFSSNPTDAELINAAKGFDAFYGTYTLEGETLTESVELAFNPNWIGHSVSFEVRWEGDQWIQTGTFPLKALGLGENDEESYEVWKRIE